MTSSDFEIARFADHDAATVEALLRAAFDRQDEADLVAALRRDGAIHSEWLAMAGDRIVGHVALSRMQEPDGWLCLAPLAVQPEWQGRGAGSLLTRHVVGMVGPGDGIETVVVLGEPEFYSANGFDLDRAQALDSRYPLDHTLICRPGDDRPAMRLVYPAAFG